MTLVYSVPAHVNSEKWCKYDTTSKYLLLKYQHVSAGTCLFHYQQNITAGKNYSPKNNKTIKY